MRNTHCFSGGVAHPIFPRGNIVPDNGSTRRRFNGRDQFPVRSRGSGIASGDDPGRRALPNKGKERQTTRNDTAARFKHNWLTGLIRARVHTRSHSIPPLSRALLSCLFRVPSRRCGHLTIARCTYHRPHSSTERRRYSPNGQASFPFSRREH